MQRQALGLDLMAEIMGVETKAQWIDRMLRENGTLDYWTDRHGNFCERPVSDLREGFNFTVCFEGYRANLDVSGMD